MKFKSLFIATALFVFLLGIVHYVHVTYLRVNVVFYAALADAFIATSLAGLAMFLIRYFRILTIFEKTLIVVIWLLAGYGFAISIPTVIDRSLSFYILEKLQQRGGGIQLDSFEKVFTEEYVREHRVVDVRLTEQLESGTITINEGCIKLTRKGDVIARFGRYYRQHFLPKNRLLMSEYSDDLTNPFRDSSLPPDYVCK